MRCTTQPHDMCRCTQHRAGHNSDTATVQLCKTHHARVVRRHIMCGEGIWCSLHPQDPVPSLVPQHAKSSGNCFHTLPPSSWPPAQLACPHVLTTATKTMTAAVRGAQSAGGSRERWASSGPHATRRLPRLPPTRDLGPDLLVPSPRRPCCEGTALHDRRVRPPPPMQLHRSQR